MTQLALFDYNTLESEARTLVQTRTDEIKALVKRTASDIIAIGQKRIDGMECFYRLYQPGEPMPFDYLCSYSSQKAIDNLARRLHDALGVV